MNTPRPFRITNLSNVAPRRLRGGWGPWHLDPETRVLYIEDPYRYEVDLDRCRTSAETLDWICQIAAKTWADATTLAGLVRALDDVLNPQVHLCPSGRSQRLSKRHIAEAVALVATHGTHWPQRAKSFPEWLTGRVDDAEVRELARHAASDPEWPGGDNLPVLREHLTARDASPALLDQLEVAWGQWRQETPP